MTVQDALRAEMRHQINPSARAAGFKGSPPNWRKEGRPGDWAVANVQFSRWGGRSATRCYINLSVAPSSWLEFRGRDSALPKTITESYGLYRRRLGTSWDVPSEASAASVVADMKACLEEDGWPLLTRLLQREEFLAELRSEGLGEIKRAHGYEAFFAGAEAVLISDDGPSHELDDLLSVMLYVPPNASDSWEADAAWIRQRAQRRVEAAGL